MQPDELQAIEREIAALRRRSDELEARRKELREEPTPGELPIDEQAAGENAEPGRGENPPPKESP